LVQCTDTAAVGSSVDALYQKLYIQSKSAPEDGRLSPETCRAELKRLINGKVVASCWLLTLLYQITRFVFSKFIFSKIVACIK